jgi:two-component system response regulator HydG
VSGRILVIDDDPGMCEMLEEALVRRGFSVVSRQSADQALELVAASEVDAVVTDLNMKGLNGLELCERMTRNRPDIPVVVITAFGSMETAVAALRTGAHDFITKPFQVEVLAHTLRRAVQHRELREEVKRLQKVAHSGVSEDLIGSSPAARQALDLLSRVAPTDASVLIEGESGTGKELAARALHRMSRRSQGPFVAVNCAAIPETLFESELFGHERGAFTDAQRAREGLFVQAHGGTLFFDEVGELPASVQAKLLRALQERRVRPVGANNEVAFDARVVAATNRDLETAVEEKRFREDLYYRLNVVRIAMPPLRSRGADVLRLAQHFLERYAQSFQKRVVGLSSNAAEKLLAYAWPGNVRELQNCVERAVALAHYEEIVVEDLPEKIRDYRPSRLLLAGDDPAELQPLEEIERRYILKVLEACGGNRRLAARTLGLDRKTLYRKLERYGGGKAAGTDD